MIIVRLMGGLGNQLFQYAVGRQLAIKNNTQLKLDLSFLLDRTPRKNFTFRDFDLPIFNIQADIASADEVKSMYNLFNRTKQKLRPNKYGFPYIKEKEASFDPYILSLPDNCYLDGHWATEDYFKEIEPKIREELRFKYPLSEQCEALVSKIKSANAICLHVRRADYVTNPDVRKILGSLNNDYYHKAVEIISQKTDAPEIFVFSDDIEWCQENLEFRLPYNFVGNNYAGPKGRDHFNLMTQCKHFIIPNSTFAWWAAWLGCFPGKIVIAPNKWFTDLRFVKNNIVPRNWIQL